MLWTSFATSIVVLKTLVVKKIPVHDRTRPQDLHFNPGTSIFLLKILHGELLHAGHVRKHSCSNVCAVFESKNTCSWMNLRCIGNSARFFRPRQSISQAILQNTLWFLNLLKSFCRYDPTRAITKTMKGPCFPPISLVAKDRLLGARRT